MSAHDIDRIESEVVNSITRIGAHARAEVVQHLKQIDDLKALVLEEQGAKRGWQTLCGDLEKVTGEQRAEIAALKAEAARWSGVLSEVLDTVETSDGMTHAAGCDLLRRENRRLLQAPGPATTSVESVAK